jgi:hypothetical protein
MVRDELNVLSASIGARLSPASSFITRVGGSSLLRFRFSTRRFACGV